MAGVRSDSSIVLLMKLIKNSPAPNEIKTVSCEVIRWGADSTLDVRPNTQRQAQHPLLVCWDSACSCSHTGSALITAHLH